MLVILQEVLFVCLFVFRKFLYALPCIVQTHFQIDTIIPILQLRKEALPKATQIGSGRVETEFRLQVQLILLCRFTNSRLGICSRMVSALLCGLEAAGCLGVRGSCPAFLLLP